MRIIVGFGLMASLLIGWLMIYTKFREPIIRQGDDIRVPKRQVGIEQRMPRARIQMLNFANASIAGLVRNVSEQNLSSVTVSIRESVGTVKEVGSVQMTDLKPDESREFKVQLSEETAKRLGAGLVVRIVREE